MAGFQYTASREGGLNPHGALAAALRPKPGAWLPAAAREKLERWAATEDTAKAAAEAAARRLRELTEQRATLATEVERVREAVAGGLLMQRDDTTGRVTSDGSDRLADAERALATLDEDIALARRRAARTGTITTPLAQIREFLRTARPGDYRPAELVEPQLQPGEDSRDAVARCRQTLAELRADRHCIASAPLPAASAKEAARRAVEAMAERGRPYVDALLEGGAIDWPDAPRGEDPLPAMRDLVAWLNRNALIDALDREIDEVAGDQSEALEPAEKRETLLRINDEILRCEREEEALIVEAEAAGTPIQRRLDASPLALLEVEETRR